MTSYVTQYLTRCAKDPQSLIEKGKGYGVYPVSYTHLDVYKRQIVKNKKFAASTENSPANAWNLNFGDSNPVSYTHLIYVNHKLNRL